MIADASSAGVALWPVVLPLTAATLAALFRRFPLVQRSVMEVTVLLLLAADLLLLARVADGTTAVVNFGGWGAPFGVTFVADRLSAALCTVAGIVAVAVATFARADIRARRRHVIEDLLLALLIKVSIHAIIIMWTHLLKQHV